MMDITRRWQKQRHETSFYVQLIAYKKIQKHQHDWTENSTNCKKLESRSTIINQQGHTKNPIVLKYTHFLFSIQNCSDMSF